MHYLRRFVFAVFCRRVDSLLACWFSVSRRRVGTTKLAKNKPDAHLKR